MGGASDHDLHAAQRAALARVDWHDVLSRLERFALARGASPWSAADAAQSAATQLLSGASAWDPAARPDVARYLMGVVRSLLSTERESAQRRYESPSANLDEALAAVTNSHADAHEAQERDARAADALGRLRSAVDQDADALAVLGLTLEGVGKAADQSAKLGIPVERVYDARDRISRHVRLIAQDMAKELEEVAQ